MARLAARASRTRRSDNLIANLKLTVWSPGCGAGEPFVPSTQFSSLRGHQGALGLARSLATDTTARAIMQSAPTGSPAATDADVFKTRIPATSTQPRVLILGGQSRGCGYWLDSAFGWCSAGKRAFWIWSGAAVDKPPASPKVAVVAFECLYVATIGPLIPGLNHWMKLFAALRAVPA